MGTRLRRRTFAPSRPAVYPDQIGLLIVTVLALLAGTYVVLPFLAVNCGVRRCLTSQSEEHQAVVDFTLSDEQKDIRQLAHDFAEKEIRPVGWEVDTDSTFPAENIRR